MAEGTGEAASAGALLVAERLLGAVREEISRADSKASILLSGAVAVLAVLAAGRKGRSGTGRWWCWARWRGARASCCWYSACCRVPVPPPGTPR